MTATTGNQERLKGREAYAINYCAQCGCSLQVAAGWL